MLEGYKDEGDGRLAVDNGSDIYMFDAIIVGVEPCHAQWQTNYMHLGHSQWILVRTIFITKLLLSAILEQCTLYFIKFLSTLNVQQSHHNMRVNSAQIWISSLTTKIILATPVSRVLQLKSHLVCAQPMMGRYTFASHLDILLTFTLRLGLDPSHSWGTGASSTFGVCTTHDG